MFLDEIGDVPLGVQSHLLRFLETGEARRLGEARSVRFDVRIIAATNRRLSEDVAEGRFRQDLYYRLAVLQRHIPPLRERLDDLEALVAWWLRRLAERQHRGRITITPQALAVLHAHDWPGNIRELRNVLERAICLTSSDELAVADIMTALGADVVARTRRGRQQAILDATLTALEKHEGNQAETAHALGVNRSTLWRRLRRCGLGRPRRDT